MKLIDYSEDICDYWIKVGPFQLFVFKKEWQITSWGIGRKFGDGAFAISTPWFLFYPGF